MALKDKLIAMKRVEVRAPYTPKGKKAAVGREKWELELEGVPALTVSVDIPAATHKKKEPARSKAVSALVKKTAEKLLKDHYAAYAV